MATILKIKRSSGASKPSLLKLGEIAYSYGDAGGSFPKQLFLGVDGTVPGNSGDAQRIAVIGGEYFTALLDHTAGTLTAGSAILVDSNKAIDTLIVGNSTTLGGEIQFKEGTNNGNLYIGLKAPNNITVSKTYVLPLSDGASGEYLKTDGQGNLSFGVTDEFVIGNTAAGTLKLKEASVNGVNFVGFKAPDALAGDRIWTLPSADGANEEYLKTDGQGNLSFGIANNLVLGSSSQIGGSIELREATVNGVNSVKLKSPTALANSLIFTLPSVYGTNGQYLKTDASGNLEFSTVDTTIEIATDSGTGSLETSEQLTITGGTGLDSAWNDQTNTLTINVTDSGINTTQIADTAVTNAKLANKSVLIGAQVIELGAAATTDLSGITSLVVDDLTLNGQTISTLSANKDIALSPHGTGTVTVPAGYKDRGGFSTNSLATKEYVDATTQGLDVKDGVKVATTTNLTATYNNGTAGVGATLTYASAITTLDDIALTDGDRILVKNQTNAFENGIYVRTSSTVWTRAVDADTSTDLSAGTFVFVAQGTLNGDNGYVFTHDGLPTIGTTALPVSQFSGAGQITDGAALLKTGNTLDVRVDNSSIEITADLLNVKALGVTNAMLAGSIANSKLANPTITLVDESSTTSSISLGQTLSILAGEGINTQINGTVLTIIGELATDTNAGVAFFPAAEFTVTSGSVAITTIDGGTYQ